MLLGQGYTALTYRHTELIYGHVTLPKGHSELICDMLHWLSDTMDLVYRYIALR